ncbi:MAG: hypothetical protein N3F09_07915 [Bacteroidia bacterium]|nr:hypothetical protein [Bacteroidia bacterium]
MKYLSKSNHELSANKIEFVTPFKHDPDIFYILLDGYASDKILKKFYHFDNSFFKNELKKCGFVDYPDIITYYYDTQNALSSIFNMYFIDRDSIKNYTIKHNTLFRYLLQRGYNLKYLESGYNVTSHLLPARPIPTGGINEFERSLLRLTLFRFDELFGGLAYQRIKHQLYVLNNIEHHLSEGPDFVFAHFVCPHPPFVFDKFGNRKKKFINQDNFWEPKEDFVEQTQAINRFLLPLMKKLATFKNSIIILQSDHGPWITHQNPDSIFTVRENILTCIKWNTTSPPADSLRHSINTFRMVIKHQFDTAFKLLPHREKAVGNLKQFMEIKKLIK